MTSKRIDPSASADSAELTDPLPVNRPGVVGESIGPLPAAEGRVDAVRSGEWWAIAVPSLRGVFSQARQIDEVPAAAREAIALMLDVDPAKVGPIDVHVQDPGGAGALA